MLVPEKALPWSDLTCQCIFHGAPEWACCGQFDVIRKTRIDIKHLKHLQPHTRTLALSIGPLLSPLYNSNHQRKVCKENAQMGKRKKSKHPFLKQLANILIYKFMRTKGKLKPYFVIVLYTVLINPYDAGQIDKISSDPEMKIIQNISWLSWYQNVP